MYSSNYNNSSLSLHSGLSVPLDVLSPKYSIEDQLIEFIFHSTRIDHNA